LVSFIRRLIQKLINPTTSQVEAVLTLSLADLDINR
jgi:hypothetical protein